MVTMKPRPAGGGTVMHKPRFSAFYDFHTSPACHDVGRAFDAAAVARQLKRCGVDFTTFAARCNQGMAYYDTKIGIRHPSLDYDLFGRFLDACHGEGIAVSAYMNVGLSHEEGLRHRDWLTVTPEGELYRTPRDNHFFRTMCYASPYGDHVLAMIDELLAYPVDGFFFDCFTPHACIGVECATEMRERGMDPETFARFAQLRLARRIGEKLKAGGRELLVYFNGLRFADQLEWATYLEFECLPTGGWGYESLQVGARHLRTLGKPTVNMTGRFHETWGDFGGLRTHASILYDCVTGYANTLPPNIADHFHPRGELNLPVYDLIAGIYDELQPLSPWTENAVAVTEMAVVAPPDAFDNTIPAIDNIRAMQGWTRLLCELHRQFDVILPEQDFSAYPVLVLADDVRFDDALRRRVDEHLARGGKVLASHRSGLGLGDPGDPLDYPEAWGVEYLGASPHSPGYFRLLDSTNGFAGAGVPAMPVALYDNGSAMRARNGARVAAEIVAPYFNRHVDFERSHLYTPPDAADGTAALALNGPVAHFSFPVGFSYYKHAQIAVRGLVKGVLASLAPEPLLAVDGLPAFGRATVTAQPDQQRRIVWLTSFIPERRGEKIDMIEEGIELRDLAIRLRSEPGRPARKVYLAPTGEPLSFTEADGYIAAILPRLPGYAAVVFE